jgi:tRNA (mo5U34)-methyltransferase
MMNGSILEKESSVFADKLAEIKAGSNVSFGWYPYRSLGNFIALKKIFDKYTLDRLIGASRRSLDIGAADGDLAFFLESLGYQADIVDYPPTNYNHLQGAKWLKEKLGSSVNIYERDLDAQFPELTEKYGLIILLGILYHLKNPFYVLENLSRSTENLIVSTRIAKYTRQGAKIATSPVAYLLDPEESNNDSTNYWIFSRAGLERIFDRTGWTITEMYSVGDLVRSNPTDQKRDERAVALLKSRNFKPAQS